MENQNTIVALGQNLSTALCSGGSLGLGGLRPPNKNRVKTSNGIAKGNALLNNRDGLRQPKIQPAVSLDLRRIFNFLTFLLNFIKT